MENNKKKSIIPTIILTILSLLWIYPIILILLNSLKKESAITTTGVFELPLGEIWNGVTNYVASVTQMDFLKFFQKFRKNLADIFINRCSTKTAANNHENRFIICETTEFAGCFLVSA